ncbi:hypothetical protein J6590_023610 [Homalodisca vitripennis]|nr:hypothetical protein J6590_023610 [Homalodisca vitripennis]
MTVGVGRVRSLRVKGSCQPSHKGVPSLACFYWRGWFRAGFSFFRGGSALNCSHEFQQETNQKILSLRKQPYRTRCRLLSFLKKIDTIVVKFPIPIHVTYVRNRLPITSACEHNQAHTLYSDLFITVGNTVAGRGGRATHAVLPIKIGLLPPITAHHGTTTLSYGHPLYTRSEARTNWNLPLEKYPAHNPDSIDITRKIDERQGHRRADLRSLWPPSTSVVPVVGWQDHSTTGLTVPLSSGFTQHPKQTIERQAPMNIQAYTSPTTSWQLDPCTEALRPDLCVSSQRTRTIVYRGSSTAGNIEGRGYVVVRISIRSLSQPLPGPEHFHLLAYTVCSMARLLGSRWYPQSTLKVNERPTQ